MAYGLEHNKSALPKLAVGAIGARRAVVIDATGRDRVVEADRGDGPILGVSKAAADDGGPVAVQIEGIAPMVASEAIDEGNLVTVTDAGKLAVYDTAGDFLLGIAQEAAAADNDVIAVLIKPGDVAHA